MTDYLHSVDEIIARGVLLPLSQVARWVRPSRRSVLASYRRGMSLRQQVRSLDESARQRWLIDELRRVVRYASRETTYYAELFRRIGFNPAIEFSLDDFAALPVLERADIHRAGRDLLAKGLPLNKLQRDATGGSTGVPVEVWLGPEELGWRESGLEYPMRRIAVPSGVRTALFWGHNLDPVKRDGWRDVYHDLESNRRWFDCFRLSPDVFEAYHRAFQQWRPACIVAYASALGQFAEYLAERGHAPSYPTRCFVTGAEKLMPTHREVIQQVFKKPVHERYGSRDVGLMAFQYNPEVNLEFEIDWPNILIEPETTERLSAILVTKLHADGMPMIRYRIGDVGCFPEQSRPGQPVFVLNEIVGRVTARIWLRDGRWISGAQFPHLLKDFPIKEYTCTQRADYSVQLAVVPRSGFSEVSMQTIYQTVSQNLPGLEIQILTVDEISRTSANKWQPVMSEVRTERPV